MSKNESTSSRLPDPRPTLGPVFLNYDLPTLIFRRPTRGDIMKMGGPTVIGFDSTRNKDSLPGQWTLVDEQNMERREPLKGWRNATCKTTHHLTNLLKESILQYPHPQFSTKALKEVDEMKNRNEKPRWKNHNEKLQWKNHNEKQ